MLFKLCTFFWFRILSLSNSGCSPVNIFNDYHIVAWSGPTAISYDKCLLCNALWMKFPNGQGKSKPKLGK